ncbi:arylamine N-acetyltransferase 4 [Periconia macrospinosa]|uniref:Arylamine N-acetyltransferase 4 n=1 Tax=Periconia macrospinosa TaxID=97972 RepID=A0A2V1DI96_9PLEO|nr:arylamine N-acetyltransferase 4 [Periconia macrospinosa]
MASVLGPDALLKFIHHIGLPAKYHPENQPKLDLAYLTALHVHTISTFPYENLLLHYSAARKISINPLVVYDKFINWNRCRGGYCMENSILMNHVLKGLGFNAYTAGVRIRLRENDVPKGPYTGWRHIVNIVMLPNGDRYMVDVGFGGDGPTKPVPMISGLAIPNLGLQEIRLLHDYMQEATNRSEQAKVWIYQYRNGQDKPWNSFYAFPELEFFEDDFAIMNWYTGSSPESFQLSRMLIVKFLRRLKVGEGEDGEEEIYGKRMLINGTIKENLGGKTQVVQECKTEAERVDALEKWFSITLLEEEKSAIRGHCTELK